MAAIRLFSIFLSVLGCLLTMAAAATSGTCSDIIVRAVMNNGDVSEHKNCTQADHDMVQSAIKAAFDEIYQYPVTNSPSKAPTGLRSPTQSPSQSPSKQPTTRRRSQRKLLSCAQICDTLNYLSCFNSASGACRTYAAANCYTTYCNRRQLEEQQRQENEFTLVVLDDIFFTDPPAPGDSRKLLASTCGITEDVCIEQKAMLYQVMLSKFNSVELQCANLLLAMTQLECIMIVAN